ncbi:uncharacterized protein [Cherax quadricarinatus]|uniref:uncharacterized protein n=1 Tax=Cherax quadricarinatus TaxID=27406 RepID=UPI00237917E2|nr:uncharacterized protein LOC128691937 [Cherax quadricarinatus]
MAVWGVKSIPYEIPFPIISPFKKDESLLRLLRAKSMPSLVWEEHLTSQSTRVFSPMSFLLVGDKSIKSPSLNQRSNFDLSEGSDSTGASLITPMNSSHEEFPVEHHKLTRSSSDGHIWATRKTEFRDVRNEFPACALSSIKNLKVKFDRNLEGHPENTTERPRRTVSRKLQHSSSDEHDCPGGDTGSQHFTTRRPSRHTNLERWDTDAVKVARLDLQKPRKSIGELKQRFELCVSNKDDTHPSTQLGIHQPSEHKVGQLIDRFTNLHNFDFDDELETGQLRSKKDKTERRLSDVSTLVRKFAKLNKLRHSSSESDDASEGPPNVAKEAAPIPTVPVISISGKVRTLKADEFCFFETSSTCEPLVRSHSLRIKKTQSSPSVKRRSGSMREKRSDNTLLPPEDSTNTAKALPRNCRPLRPDELRFFGMGNNNIYSVRELNTSKEEVKEKSLNSSRIFV